MGKKNAPEYTKHQVSVVSNQLSETKLSVHGWEVEGEGEVKMGEEGGLKLRLFRFDWGLSIYHTPALSNAGREKGWLRFSFHSLRPINELKYNYKVVITM